MTLSNDIGCDVEDINRTNDVLAIAERYFSAQETNELFSLPQEVQRSRFFDYWTLKESYIKAWGLGLAIPLADFTFTINDDAYDKVNNKPFTIKNNIQLSFAPHRIDEPNAWKSWLIYPKGNDEHRIALSLRSDKNIQHTDFSLRFFNTIPLCGYEEILL